jgi:phage tail-like protein
MKQTEIASLLPGVFQRTLFPGHPLFAMLEVMEDLHAPAEQAFANLDLFFDPYRSPDRFVPFLADWVDLERLLVQSPEERAVTGTAPLPSGLGRLRDLIATAASLSRSRGTVRGLIRFLETATGVQGFQIDENVPGPDGQPKPFHMLIRAPAAAARFQIMIERIVEAEKPVYLTYELEFNP